MNANLVIISNHARGFVAENRLALIAVGVNVFWVIVYFASIQAKAYFCAPLTWYGLFIAPMISETPVCSGLNFLEQHGRESIRTMWSTLGVWVMSLICSKFVWGRSRVYTASSETAPRTTMIESENNPSPLPRRPISAHSSHLPVATTPVINRSREFLSTDELVTEIATAAATLPPSRENNDGYSDSSSIYSSPSS